jgi:hypothetical protein
MHKLKQLGQQLNMEHIVFASLIQLHVDHVQVAYGLLHFGCRVNKNEFNKHYKKLKSFLGDGRDIKQHAMFVLSICI